MQPKLFEKSSDSVEIEKVLLYALGDFQSRGKALVGRQLAFDRLRGALLRAFERFGIEELSDRQVAKGLADLGATVVEVPNFVAKHPYRIVVPEDAAQLAKIFYYGLSARDINPRQASN